MKNMKGMKIIQSQITNYKKKKKDKEKEQK